MRLFVGVWPDAHALEVVADAIGARTVPGPRWVDRSKWHVTLDFLGSVPDDEIGALVEAMARVGATTPPAVATLGPETARLGRAVLCVPVEGLEDLARAVRRATAPFNRSADRDRPFAGHLTVARAPRRGSISGGLTGIPVSASWPVGEIALVSSETRADGARYAVVSTERLAG
jgi:RNA 2',3'-cyclic 3'-phosphodiesterase